MKTSTHRAFSIARFDYQRVVLVVGLYGVFIVYEAWFLVLVNDIILNARIYARENANLYAR